MLSLAGLSPRDARIVDFVLTHLSQAPRPHPVVTFRPQPCGVQTAFAWQRDGHNHVVRMLIPHWAPIDVVAELCVDLDVHLTESICRVHHQ